MRTRQVLTITLPMLCLLVACGADDDVATSGTFTTVPPSVPTTGAPGAVDRPTGGDELVLQVDSTIAVGGDGRMYRPVEEAMLGGPQGFAPPIAPRIAPPRPPTGYTVAELSPSVVDDLYARAAELGLLDHPITPGEDYDWCCDRVGHRLSIGTGDAVLEHVVPGLGEEDLETEELAAVADMIQEVLELPSTADLGPVRSYVPEQWRVVEAYDRYLGDVDVPEWPLDEAPTIGACVELPTAAESDTASGPYRADGMSVAAEPLLPWEQC